MRADERKETRTKALLSLVLVLGWISGTDAALTLVNVPTQPITIGQTTTITVRSTTEGDYSGWLQIEDPSIANFDAVPQFTSTGNPGGLPLSKVGCILAPGTSSE